MKTNQEKIYDAVYGVKDWGKSKGVDGITPSDAVKEIKAVFKAILKDENVSMSDQTYTYLLAQIEKI